MIIIITWRHTVWLPPTLQKVTLRSSRNILRAKLAARQMELCDGFLITMTIRTMIKMTKMTTMTLMTMTKLTTMTTMTWSLEGLEGLVLLQQEQPTFGWNLLLPLPEHHLFNIIINIITISMLQCILSNKCKKTNKTTKLSFVVQPKVPSRPC